MKLGLMKLGPMKLGLIKLDRDRFEENLRQTYRSVGCSVSREQHTGSLCFRDASMQHVPRCTVFCFSDLNFAVRRKRISLQSLRIPFASNCLHYTVRANE